MMIIIKVSKLLSYPGVEYVTSTLKKLLDFVAKDFLGIEESQSGEPGKDADANPTEEAVTDETTETVSTEAVN